MPIVKLAGAAALFLLTGGAALAAPENDGGKPACTLGLPLSVAQDWQNHLMLCIKSNFKVGSGQEGKGGEARLSVTINPDGTLAAVSIDQSSGVEAQDKAARAAVYRAAPLQPFTSDMPKTAQTIIVTFAGGG